MKPISNKIRFLHRLRVKAIKEYHKLRVRKPKREIVEDNNLSVFGYDKTERGRRQDKGREEMDYLGKEHLNGIRYECRTCSPTDSEPCTACGIKFEELIDLLPNDPTMPDLPRISAEVDGRECNQTYIDSGSTKTTITSALMTEMYGPKILKSLRRSKLQLLDASDRPLNCVGTTKLPLKVGSSHGEVEFHVLKS